MAAALAFAAIAAEAAQAQELLYEWHGGGTAGNGLGQVVRPAGDVDADGHDDVIVGYRLGSGNQAGTARVFSGRTGAILYTFTGSVAGDMLGAAVDGAGDLNADGRDDLLVGVRGHDGNGFDSGAARVYSGADGLLLFEVRGESQRLRMGWSVSGVGDVNGDGCPDIAVGANPDSSSIHPAGFVRVYSGATQMPLYEVSGATAVSRMGHAVRAAGDVDGDGVIDLVIGDPRDATRGFDAGAVHVRSGVDGSALHVFHGVRAGDQLGFAVDGVGDLDGDDLADVIGGAPQYDAVLSNCGLARVYSGATGAVLYELVGDGANDLFASSVAGCGDADGDLVPDLIVGAPNDDDAGADSGSARLHSGADGSLLWRVDGNSGNDRLGSSVAAAGDLDADRGMDWIVGAPLDAFGTAAFAGSARVYRGVPPPSQGPVTYCVSTANSVGPGAIIGSSGSTSVSADDLALHVSGMPASTHVKFVFGANQAGFPFQKGVLCVAKPLNQLPPIIVAGEDGSAMRMLDLDSGISPIELIQPGTIWHFQALYLDVSGSGGAWNTSNGLMVTFLP